MDENYVYETKCRICGEVYEWSHVDKVEIRWVEFADIMADHIRDPRLKVCKKCKKQTVQDVVSYTPFENI